MNGAWLAVCGHTNIDVQVGVKRLPVPGTSEPVQWRRTVYGGTGCNIARHAAGLGVPTRLWSRVGTDFPADWRAALEDDGLQLSLDVDARAATPTCYILIDDTGEQSFCMDQAAMGPPIVDNPPGAGLLAGLTDWLHIGTGAPAAYEAIASAAREARIAVAFDPGQEINFAYDDRSLTRMLDRSDLYWCNRQELDIALRMLRYGDAEQLLDHVRTVIVTQGADGVLMHRRGHRPLHVEALPTEVVDATGAGDAFRAGWYAGRHAGHDEAQALTWGLAAAQVILGLPGPQPRALRLDDIADIRLPDVAGR